MKVAAFLFDLDGTLIDTEKVWTEAIVDFIVDRGGNTTYEEILPNVIGRNWLDIHRTIHEMFPVIGDTSAVQDAMDLRSFYDRRAGDPEKMKIVDSIAFFKKAAEKNVCAVVSGSPHDDIVSALKLCGLLDSAKLILGAGEYEAGKPSPSGYLKAAEMLGVNPADCVVIEDSGVGVASGVAAGMKVIALDRGNSIPQNYSGAEWKVNSLLDIDFEKEFS
jgi:beta-phosphoglucomutase-like phosphatase (HAD superfamily)